MKIEPHIEAMLAQVELRVLYGPQAGSRLPLSPGNYLLGTGDDCAVMLAGPRMRETHASLDFNGEIPSVTPIDGSVFDAQGNEVQGTFALRLGMPVELGGVWITIDHVESEWPDPEEVAAIAGLASPPPPQEFTPVPQTTAENDTAPGTARRKISRAWLASSAPIAAVALLGIIAFGITAWLLQNHPAKSGAITTSDADRHSDAILALRDVIARAAPEHNLSVTQGSDGSLKVDGYTRDSASRTKILEAIRKHGSVATITIHVDSELLEATRKVVERQANPRNSKVTVQTVTNGRAELSGAISNAAIRDSLVERIRAEVPGIAYVSGALLTTEDLSVLLQDKIVTSGLGARLQIVEQQPEFVVRGRLSEQDVEKWESLLSDFGKEYASLLPIRATIAVMRRKPPVDVQMVVGGAMPFVVTEDGRRIGKGGDSNGHTLSIVGDHEVIFDGSERFRIAR